MRYVYETAAYGPDPIRDLYWSTTVPSVSLPTLNGSHKTDVAVIGAGFTGLSAAYHLGQAGVDVTVMDAQHPMFGATGRNGGFCCLGGGKISNARLDTLYGSDQRQLYRQAEKAAVDLVDQFISDHDLNVDRHSNGETLLAHKPKHAQDFPALQAEIQRDYGVTADILGEQELRQNGLGGAFHGAITTPIGFGLNPQKYASGLLQMARTKGAKIYANTLALRIVPTTSGYDIATPNGTVSCNKFIIATNGYSSEDMFPWMRARFLPVQSSVIVTRPITDQEQTAQGWTSAQMAYDSRFLLHYFRMMPNNRFLFGMRGGLHYTKRSNERIRQKIRHDFAEMFPAWRDVIIDYEWSGLVALNRSETPYVGEIPGYAGGYAGFGYHGNGVAMASYSGALLSDMVLDRIGTRPNPKAFQHIPTQFPLGRFRRYMLTPIYALAQSVDL